MLHHFDVVISVAKNLSASKASAGGDLQQAKFVITAMTTAGLSACA